VWKSKFYGAFVLNRPVVHAIDATPARSAPLVDFDTVDAVDHAVRRFDVCGGHARVVDLDFVGLDRELDDVALDRRGLKAVGKVRAEDLARDDVVREDVDQLLPVFFE